MKEVFTKSTIAGIEFKNKIFRSATFEGLSDQEGRPTKKLSDLYIKLAKGEVGAIITGLIGVQRKGRTNFRMCMLDRDDFIDDYRQINVRLKEYGVPVIAQLAHGGGQCDKVASGGFNLAPSRKFYALTNKFSQILSEENIIDVINCFISAIERAKKSGFAGVQLHAAHGYLLSEFLSGGLNRRKDKWGGSTENRFRIIAEIMKGARERVGNYPILAKFSAYDYLKNGISMDEGLRIAVMFQRAGIDALEVSSGANDGLNTIRAPQIPSDSIIANMLPIKIKSGIIKRMLKKTMPLFVKRYDPIYHYNVSAAEKIKQKIDIPVIVVGGIRNINDIHSIINGGKADYVSMCRPLIMEPNLVKKFKEGKQDNSRCIDCCYCMFGLMNHSLRCYYGKLPA
ncbi:MAG: NADH:flavin oxidoreductase [Syntrophaceae bacterium]|nr:NADH:flavin oxidoreductase [Syntrophaceae bacterium]